jgi:hypothetical protein
MVLCRILPGIENRSIPPQAALEITMYAQKCNENADLSRITAGRWGVAENGMFFALFDPTVDVRQSNHKR